MGPQIGESTEFERSYIHKLRALLSPHGILVDYDADLAAIDFGIHLYDRSGASLTAGGARVWIQAKGIRATTVSIEELRDASDVTVKGLLVDHLRYWYVHPEPVYLAVYLEALDEFLIEDVRVLIDARGGLEQVLARGGQRTSIAVPLECSVERAVTRLPAHRSMRIDGPTFRGRPLGHRFDPLRSELAPMKPELFRSLVANLMSAHEYEPKSTFDVADALGLPEGTVDGSVGTMQLTYEWTSPLFTEFGVNHLISRFRLESPPHNAQGQVAVILHVDPNAVPRSTGRDASLADELRSAGIHQALVFINASDYDYGLLGGWRRALDGLVRLPQGLGSITFNVLTTTLVYLQHLPDLRWRHLNYL